MSLALVTSSDRWKVDVVFAQLGLEGTFDAVVTGSEVEQGKPHPACYRLAAERLGIAAGECLVYEDAISGVLAAWAGGSVAVVGGERRFEHRGAIDFGGGRVRDPALRGVNRPGEPPPARDLLPTITLLLIRSYPDGRPTDENEPLPQPRPAATSPRRSACNSTTTAGPIVADLVAKLNQHGHPITREQLERVVAENDKQRFAFSDDGARIRASQGHSIKVDLALVASEPPEILYHGTATPRHWSRSARRGCCRRGGGTSTCRPSTPRR